MKMVCCSAFVHGHVHLGKALIPEVMYQQVRKPHVIRLAGTHEIQGSWSMRYFIIPSFWASENYCTSFKQNTGLDYHSLWSQMQDTALPCRKLCKQNRKTLSRPPAWQSKDLDIVKSTYPSTNLTTVFLVCALLVYNGITWFSLTFLHRRLSWAALHPRSPRLGVHWADSMRERVKFWKANARLGTYAYRQTIIRTGCECYIRDVAHVAESKQKARQVSETGMLAATLFGSSEGMTYASWSTRAWASPVPGLVPGWKADVVTCLFCLAKGQYFLADDEGDKALEERKETLYSLSLGTEAASLCDSAGSGRQWHSN